MHVFISKGCPADIDHINAYMRRFYLMTTVVDLGMRVLYSAEQNNGTNGWTPWTASSKAPRDRVAQLI